jgi:hypothetical protein
VTANPGRSFGARPGPCWTRGPADVTREFEVSAQAIRNWVAQSDPPKGPGTRSVAALAAALFAASKAVVIHGSWGMVFLVFSLTRASRLGRTEPAPTLLGFLNLGNYTESASVLGMVTSHSITQGCVSRIREPYFTKNGGRQTKEPKAVNP